MNKKIISAVLVSIGILLIMAAIALAGFNIWDDYRAGNMIESIDKQLEIPEIQAVPNEIPDYVLNPDMDMPTVKIGGYEYIGKVRIPSLKLKLPVMDTWSYPQMRIAPCRYKGSAYLNNLIICAHNYASHFGRLKNLDIGDKVIFTDVDGNVFNYEVKHIDTLTGGAVEEMESGEWDLTLFTCTIGGRLRVTVRCSLTDE